MGFFLDSSILSAASHALSLILSVDRLVFVVAGVLVGIAIGLVPGVGGLTGFALLVPFTYTMDPIAALGMLLGMHSVTATSDVLGAVLLGVPGSAASQATVLDGLPMTKRGEASRALSACYTSSLMGGLIGAAILAISLPLIRPLVLAITTPEMLALTIFGITMVSVLSGKAPLRGVIAACFGILIGMIGPNVETGQLRWTGHLLYLEESIPILPVLLGVFALPELCDLAIKRTKISNHTAVGTFKGMGQGVRDTLRSWFLVLRCAVIGAFCGTVPGITGSVTDWIAYGHALQTEKGASKSFGKGDVRGVIAPEAANNSREGGMLVPMLAFGLPGGAAQAILLGALMVHGFNPGPDMLTKHLDLTYSMVWSIAIANIFGAGLCFLFSGQFAKIAALRYSLILPVIIPVVMVGAFQGSRSWGDLFVVLIAGLIGWIMKRQKWPRPPLILGLVLGLLIERYMSISFLRYDTDWLLRPGVLVLLTLSAIVLLSPLFRLMKKGELAQMLWRPEGGKIAFRPDDLTYVFFIGVAVYMLVTAQKWNFLASIGPTVVSSILIIAGTISLAYKIFFTSTRVGASGNTRSDASGELNSLPDKIILLRAARFFGWFLAFLASTALIGMLPTIPLVIIAFMRIESREPWRLCLMLAICVTVFLYFIFDRMLHIAWPSHLLFY
ncbi:MAG: tripartite tricarboxylate transporter permease [Enterobacterales bacterium endosymbiont of Blomia tropicalis]|uniref:tripartite tricarboxylate transporter permease n=1 Tax=Mixta mediterraneensis TaxID=2758443 RepID=UPI0025A6C1CA|nr:tripartite tricarboxylate transporter permease [Mixta mediterraneensis]MDL4915103.1 tripartite tricarboxylate transporter permease [Mixta mediterraneensis]